MMRVRIPAITAPEYVYLTLSGLSVEVIIRLALLRQAVWHGRLARPEER